MRAFVAGGNGVLGRALLRLLIRDGHEVVATARTKEKADLVRALGAEPVFVDLLNRDGLEFALQGCRWIFNATSAIPKDLTPDGSAWRANDRVRTEGTRNLTYAARTVRVEAYVHESVALVFGDHGDAWIDERTSTNPGPRLGSAMDGERIVAEAVRDGLPAVVLRPGQFYAADAWHTRYIVDQLRARKLRVPGRGQNCVSPVHVEDVAAAFVAAARRAPAGETFLVADDRPVTLREYADVWAAALGAPPAKSAPRFLARLALGRESLGLIAMSQRLSNRKAREGLGWAPRYPSITEGAAAVVRELR
ncbi:MAG TPA: NAD-dependent epimerase/dehydratase family protein [Thermoplasmata archaeon]|nr:NAD-dependent epimerase/dehydratase family protein [Thermoplasmata archaeon]